MALTIRQRVRKSEADRIKRAEYHKKWVSENRERYNYLKMIWARKNRCSKKTGPSQRGTDGAVYKPRPKKARLEHRPGFCRVCTIRLTSDFAGKSSSHYCEEHRGT